MQNIFKSKYSLVFSIIILIVVFVYLFKTNNPYTSPTQVLTPESYPEGTTVELWNNIPPEFPQGIILENKEIEHADVVTSLEGKKQITVSYTSEKSMSELAEMYMASIEKSEWALGANNVSPKVATILSTKGVEMMIITILPKEGGGTVVAFQYEK